jgi:hypothetical protein
MAKAKNLNGVIASISMTQWHRKWRNQWRNSANVKISRKRKRKLKWRNEKLNTKSSWRGEAAGIAQLASAAMAIVNEISLGGV